MGHIAYLRNQFQSLFCNNLPMEKCWALHLNKLESPLRKDALCQVWLKLAQGFLRKRFLKFINVFSLFRNYLPLKKGMALHLNKLESTSPKDTLCQVWLKLALWFWRKRWKCEKFTDRRWTKSDQKSSFKLSLRWANKWQNKKFGEISYFN